MARRRTLLFADDHHVLYRSGTRRVLRPFERYAENPLIQGRDRAWEGALAWNSVHRDPQSGLYQLWYQSFTGAPARQHPHDCVVCYAESEDGIHFVRPELSLFSYGGHERTNIVLVGNGGHSYRYGNSVLVDPGAEDPERRYRMAYFDFARDGEGEYPGLCAAFSADGIHWRKHPRAPLVRVSYGRYGSSLPFADEEGRPWDLPLSMSDGLDAMWDPVRGVYAIYGKMWLDGPDGGMYWKHGMGRIESADFVHWSEPELILAPDELDPPWVEFHTVSVFYHEGLYVALIQILDRATGGGVIDVELATSRDGLFWQRPFRDQYALVRGQGECFDSGSLFTNATPVVLDREMRFYYGAYSGGATGADDRGHRSGIGMARIPRDRLAGIQPVDRSDQPTLAQPLEHVGQVTLRPLDLRACGRLWLNADAAQGSVRAEVLDAATRRRLRGFAREDAAPVRGDHLAHELVWKERALDQLPPGPHLLRLHLEKAAVYALYLEEN